MNPTYPPLPLFVVARNVDYDEQRDELGVSDGNPWLMAAVGKIWAIPAFTTTNKAAEFMEGYRVRGSIVTCEAERLLQILAVVKPGGVTIDLDPIRRRGTTYSTNSVIDWLNRELGRKA